MHLLQLRMILSAFKFSFCFIACICKLYDRLGQMGTIKIQIKPALFDWCKWCIAWIIFWYFVRDNLMVGQQRIVLVTQSVHVWPQGITMKKEESKVGSKHNISPKFLLTMLTDISPKFRLNCYWSIRNPGAVCSDRQGGRWNSLSSRCGCPPASSERGYWQEFESESFPRWARHQWDDGSGLQEILCKSFWIQVYMALS